MAAKWMREGEASDTFLSMIWSLVTFLVGETKQKARFSPPVALDSVTSLLSLAIEPLIVLQLYRHCCHC